MRFNIKENISITRTLLIAVSIYIVFLGVQGDLDRYIHPRYIIFTIVMAAIAAFVFIFHTPERSGHSHTHSLGLGIIPLLVVVGLALVLPPRSLSSNTVSQRLVDDVAVVSTNSSVPIDTLFAGSSKGLNITDWSRLLLTNTDEGYYSNKPAVVSGFVFDADLGPDHVWLARFVLSCCAVDAQPVGVPVHIENWEEQFEQDQWVEVEGIFEFADTDQGRQLVLEPERVEAIDEPDNPYASR